MGNIDLGAIVDICAGYSGDCYYVEEMIPAKKLNNARAAFPIPAEEHVIALVDATTFRSAKNGLVIGTKGIYWHNDWMTDTAQQHLPWTEFVKVNVQRKGLFEIELGSGNNFNMSGSSFKKDVLIRLLQQLQQYVQITLSADDDGASLPAEALESATDVPPPAPGTDNEWMVAVAGQQYGPYSESILRTMIETNRIHPAAAYIWKPGMANWVPLLQQPELADMAGIPTPPAVAPPEAAAAAESETEEDTDHPSAAVDVNTAPLERLVELPFIGAIGARRLIRERELSGGLQSIEECGRLLDLKPHQVERLRPLVAFGPAPERNRTGRVVDY